MTVSLAARTCASFEIKSAHLPLVALLLKSADLALLGQELTARFGDMPDFFDHDPLVIDLSPLQAQGDVALDFGELTHLLRGFRVLPVAVKGGSATQMDAARAAGLAAADDALIRAPLPAAQEPAHLENAPAPPPLPSPSALVIDKPLRSGQQVYARGRDAVVLAMVNPGAEIIADGHVHVYAPLRGKAIAGARGNTEARIFTLCLEPELVSIAGIYRTSETPWPASVRGLPAQIRLQGGGGGKLVIDRLNP